MTGHLEPSPAAPPVCGKAYDFLLWLLPKIEHFPKIHRFTIGERLASRGLDLMSALTEAAYAQRKESLLLNASHRVNDIRFLLRLAKDLKLMSIDAYGFSAASLDEIGRMTGGWRKSLPARG